MNRTVFTSLLRSLLLAILVLEGGSASAQAVRLSEEPGQFMVDIKKLMESSKNPAYLKAAEELESIWMSQLNTTQQLQFVGQVRRLAAKGQKAGPVFALLMHNLHTVTTQQGDINGLMIMLDKASDKYDGKTLLRLLETTQLILEKKQLYASNTNKLYLTEGQYRFRFDDSRPDAGSLTTVSDGWDTPADTNFSVLTKSQPMPTLSGALLDLQEATFAIVTAHDSVAFGPSTGSVSLREGTFVGKGGKFTWEAAGNPALYAALDEYTFNMASPKLLAENVTLHYDEKLAQPVKGTFEFRSARRAAGKPTTYPRFISQKNDAVLRNARKSMAYRGGLTLLGTSMYSTSLSNEPSTLVVSYKDRPAFRATSLRFALNDSVVSAPLATFSMPLGRDSIYHVGVVFRYSDDAGLLRLERADGTAYGGIAYQDSYHKMNIWAEGMRWSLGKDQVEFYMISGKKEVPVRLESYDYFRPQRFQAMAEEFGFQPLLMATTYVQSEKKQTFTPDELATKLRQNPTILRRALEQLSLQGYFEYNQLTDEYRVTRKGILYVLANFDKSDYDNFQISSHFQANSDVANATINLKDTLLTVRGVERFVVSDSLKIIATPSDKQVVIGRNRDFTLNGQMKSANFRFAGRDLKFNYDQFFVNLNQVDSITFTPQEKYAKGLSGEVGGHVKYEKGGTFYLNDPKNKSGKQKGTKSPRLVVPEGMTVFFDQPIRSPILYDQSVFFKIPKLDYDSLDRRDVAFVGTFNSDGMLPPIKTTLKSMEDNSLGFEYKPSGDVKVYNGQATVKFTDPLVMDNKGLRASGVLSHLSATLPTEKMLFTSDSLVASGAEASIKEATIGKGYFPKVELKNYSLRWIPKTDSMLILSKGNSFNFYNGSSKLEGGLLLRSSGLYGYGHLKRSDSELRSQDIKFNKEGFVANQSQFTITDGQQQSFRSILLGRNVDVDFNVAKGQVELATNATGFGADSSSLEFPYAAYRTSISKARWDINKKSIAMKGDVKTSTFTSTAPEQEGLTFNGSAAVYEVEKMMLSISGVPYIRTADVKIIPDKGVVSVKKNGEMNAFKNARIEIDTLNSSHRLRNADIRITSRNRFEGSATYQYITARKDTFNIKMENFELRELGAPEVTASRRAKSAPSTQPAGTTYYTTARAEVREDDKLVLSPRMQFKGGVRLIAYEPSLQLDGYIRPMLKPRPDLTSSWIVYKEAPGEILTIKVDKNLRNEVEQPLFAGLHYRPSGGMYLSFLSPKEYSRDQDIFTAEGTLRFDEESKAFRILPPPGADGLVNEARAFTFNDQKGTATFAGPLKLVAADWLTAAGTVDAQVDSLRFDFNTLLLMNLPALTPVLPELAAKIVQTNLDEQNSDAAEDDPTRLNTKLAVLIGQKGADDYLTKTAAGYKPLYEASATLDAPIVLSNVDLRWSEIHGAYFSSGPIGVSNLGRHDINAQMEGMLEIRRSDRGDEFSLYLEVSPDVWYYFDYSQKQLGVVSSLVDFNDQLLAKSKNAKTKDMELISLGFEEKAMFTDRFYDFYQPALKKAKLVKAAEKKDTKKKTTKKAAETQEGF
ncbi:hypothetical protein HNQ92_005715 [Rhabdobacter roseus]|uniref:Uncharacterized protein n=1 Tax=Rhabdobacter roseus TaxID=1655419 RepID=A0A840TUC4_9BACT|nr:hypothetical protein [Rhabdobacter roseus]